MTQMVVPFPDPTRALSKLDTSVDETDQELKATSGWLLAVDVSNTHATEWAYLKFYNKTSVTVASDAPDWSIAVPPASAVHVSYADSPIQFTTAIHYAATQQRGAGATAITTKPTAHFRYW